MAKFAAVFLCAQALLVQTAFSQCLPYNQAIVSGCGSNIIQSGPGVSQIQVPSCGCTQSAGNIISSIGNVGSIVASGNNGGFGGNGIGQLAILGDLPIAGSTFFDGNLPVYGIVEFTGALPAGGYVSIVGSTPCECGSYNVFNNNPCY